MTSLVQVEDLLVRTHALTLDDIVGMATLLRCLFLKDLDWVLYISDSGAI